MIDFIIVQATYLPSRATGKNPACMPAPGTPNSTRRAAVRTAPGDEAPIARARADGGGLEGLTVW